MAVGYGPAPGVYLLHVGLELVGPGEDDAGEGFVYLDPVHVVDAQPCLFEYQARDRYDAGQLHDRILANGFAPRATKRARGAKPSASATSRSPISTAEAPSVS